MCNFGIQHLEQGASPIWSEPYTLLIEDPIVLALAHIDLMNGKRGCNQLRI
jgi:hypothetical protein